MPSSSSSLSLLVVTAAPVAVVVIRSGAGSRHDPSQSDPAQLGPGTRPRGLVAAVLARVGFEGRGRGGARGGGGGGTGGGWPTRVGSARQGGS